jgi:hypothetical protein
VSTVVTGKVHPGWDRLQANENVKFLSKLIISFVGFRSRRNLIGRPPQ